MYRGLALSGGNSVEIAEKQLQDIALRFKELEVQKFEDTLSEKRTPELLRINTLFQTKKAPEEATKSQKLFNKVLQPHYQPKAST